MEDSAHTPTVKVVLLSSPVSHVPADPAQHELSSSTSGPGHLRVSCVTRITSQPPCPAPSSKISQFLNLAFAGSPQPQIRPVEGIPQCSHHSTLARHPDSSTLVPSSLGSTWDYQTYSHWAPSILRLHLIWTSPRLCHGLASCPLRSVSLHPTASVWLCPPSGSTTALSCSGSTSARQNSGFTLGGRRYGSVTASEACGVVLVHLLSVYALGTLSTGVISRPHGLEEISTIPPRSLNSTMGHRSGWTQGHHLDPPAPVSTHHLCHPGLLHWLQPCFHFLCLLCALLKSPGPPSSVGPFTAQGRTFSGGIFVVFIIKLLCCLRSLPEISFVSYLHEQMPPAKLLPDGNKSAGQDFGCSLKPGTHQADVFFFFTVGVHQRFSASLWRRIGVSLPLEYC